MPNKRSRYAGDESVVQLPLPSQNMVFRLSVLLTSKAAAAAVAAAAVAAVAVATAAVLVVGWRHVARI